MQLEDKTVIITGASSGIGAAAAKLFASQGAKLVLAARREELLKAIVDDINQTGEQATYLSGDVGDEDFNKALVALAEDKFGGLHAAFNNAGTGGASGPVPEMEADNWLNVVNTNLNAAFFAAKHQIPAMKKSGAGSIIFTSSVIGYSTAFPGTAAYAASKAGLIGLAMALATEHGADGIRANTILPGATKTPMLGDLDAAPDQKAFYESLHAVKRLADPEELAQAALFLASDNSRFVTGSSMVVDGGASFNKV